MSAACRIEAWLFFAFQSIIKFLTFLINKIIGRGGLIASLDYCFRPENGLDLVEFWQIID